MHYSEIKYCDIANGVGVRTTLFVSGCRRFCPGCFNSVAWDFNHGKEFDAEAQDKIMESLEPDYIAGLTLLGGEPMEPENQEALLPFIEKMKGTYPKKDIWCFSGFTWEQLINDVPGPLTHEMLQNIDVLVDGPFIEQQHETTLRFRGSSNQRIINVPESLKTGKIIEWNDGPIFSVRGRME